ncbi:MAG: hypothetical protein WCG27_04395 [Pseudomonadota bacterium]
MDINAKTNELIHWGTNLGLGILIAIFAPLLLVENSWSHEHLQYFFLFLMVALYPSYRYFPLMTKKVINKYFPINK